MRVTLKLTVMCYLFHPFIPQIFIYHSLYTRYYSQGWGYDSKKFPMENGNLALDWRVWYIWSRALPTWRLGVKPSIYVSSFILQMEKLRSQWASHLPKTWTSVSLSVKWGIIIPAPQGSCDDNSLTSVSSTANRPILPSLSSWQSKIVQRPSLSDF